MENSVFLEKLLKAYERYYSIKKENVKEPFDVEAKFVMHGEQYILVKAARIADIDTNEFVYFKLEDDLSLEQLKNLADKAWKCGLENFVPYYGHKNSDVTLIVIADSLCDDVKKNVRKIKHSVSYKLGLYGWSNFKLAVKDLSTGMVYCNRMGSDAKKLVQKIQAED